MPSLDPLVMKLNAAIGGGWGGEFRYRRAFADYDKRSGVYRVAYRKRVFKANANTLRKRREMRMAYFTPLELDTMTPASIRESIMMQCGFDMLTEDDEETANQFARNAINSVLG